MGFQVPVASGKKGSACWGGSLEIRAPLAPDSCVHTSQPLPACLLLLSPFMLWDPPFHCYFPVTAT